MIHKVDVTYLIIYLISWFGFPKDKIHLLLNAIEFELDPINQFENWKERKEHYDGNQISYARLPRIVNPVHSWVDMSLIYLAITYVDQNVNRVYWHEYRQVVPCEGYVVKWKL